MTYTTVPNAQSRRAALAVPLAAILLLGGCSTASGGGSGPYEALAQTCPDSPMDTGVKIDESGSSSSDALRKERLDLVRSYVEKTVVCGGTFSADIFSSSSGATANLYNGELTVTAPTEAARLRKAAGVVDEVMEEISNTYGSALATLPSGGSDISSILRLFGEQAAQHPDAFHDYVLITDGIQNIGDAQITGALTPEQATSLADRVNVPTLPADTSLTIAGLGRVSGDPVPSEVIEGVVSFYTVLCTRTGAGECLVVTDAR
ncbi:hypothetical protein [uncultured Microbacterium sp.]|uniref:hypothetical protein n=1 Tax=uncultured Microbacterium sp. TaxID=191216 RepID=UPI0028E7DCC8|nr:hypothetical protein [uncultured Microbacterium sp.]